jgi:hypothetical protein
MIEAKMAVVNQEIKEVDENEEILTKGGLSAQSAKDGQSIGGNRRSRLGSEAQLPPAIRKPSDALNENKPKTSSHLD